MAKPIQLDTRYFPRTADAMKFFSDMLARYRVGEQLVGDDFADLRSLIDRHPEATEKIGCGISALYVDNTDYGSKGFWITRVDGSGTDFSYRRCVSGTAPTPESEVKRAFRWAVRQDIQEAAKWFWIIESDKNGKLVCGSTGDLIDYQEGHIDHVPPKTFESLLEDYLAAKDLDFRSIPISTGRDNQVAPEITDPMIVKDFRRYHARIARLDFIRKEINLGQAMTYRIKNGRVSIR